MSKELIDFLKEFVLEERFSNFQKVLNNRTRYITVVLEDIFQSQNASAVLRTADCFGLQDIHIIENKYQYQVNPDVSLGSANWLNLYKYNNSENNTLETIHFLKNNGYRIIATTPHKNDIDLEKLNLNNGKVALFFGTELNGLSDIVLDNADEYLKIPMVGFTESFNISVSAAIIMYELTRKLRMSDINWQLTDAEKDEIMLCWLKQTLRKPELLIKKFYQKK
ncbi:MAG: RNA methyltransferase [Bacteroidetes bacterium GWC2_33_15]|nr:MAG: RNA methyltransferase [Bacteroidetes bacterium GWA2_33_15]OFX51080.1 MAG: RNA methyltransferase [Bacteroidetes bacterium GWC2_33_15]OFX66487.1 MAG: RNA methyltransferase [Bacteroidetes bacterium GWB2_32_14]OFX70288.1 MAG: RNA methyltransferase [Bacteroidetes bacterium GWD2_33_33]HAN17285.1 TrmH family RNA methyltransferase [Bacteroidales bacterium]